MGWGLRKKVVSIEIEVGTTTFVFLFFMYRRDNCNVVVVFGVKWLVN